MTRATTASTGCATISRAPPVRVSVVSGVRSTIEDVIGVEHELGASEAGDAESSRDSARGVIAGFRKDLSAHCSVWLRRGRGHQRFIWIRWLSI